MKILFVASEGLPFSKTGGLADVIEALPRALASLGHQVAVFLPRYEGNEIKSIALPRVPVQVGTAMRFPTVADAGVLHGVQYFLLDDPEYFDRDSLYGSGGKDYPDNPERFTAFSRAAVEVARGLWPSDVIHCHDWQSALVPALLRTVNAEDPLFRVVSVVFTVHNLGYQGLFEASVFPRLGIPQTLFSYDGLEFFGKVNFLKAGLLYADSLTTVSRKYAQEIQTPEYGFGLEGVLQSRATRLTGILNGVDYSEWNPETDKLIPANYSAENMAGKTACKKALLETFGLPSAQLSRPLIGIVSRFTDQKGFDLIAQVAKDLLKEDFSLVALGTGEPKYEELFRSLAQKAPQKVAVRIAYDNALAHLIEAGSDMFLMPSRYEPSGLNQMYSLRYGAVPIVRATGGLDDTVDQFEPSIGRGTGFKFGPYDGRLMLDSIRQALRLFQIKATWARLVSNGMARDFSWKNSAQEYARLYETARQSRIQKAAGTSN